MAKTPKDLDFRKQPQGSECPPHPEFAENLEMPIEAAPAEGRTQGVWEVPGLVTPPIHVSRLPGAGSLLGAGRRGGSPGRLGQMLVETAAGTDARMRALAPGV